MIFQSYTGVIWYENVLFLLVKKIVILLNTIVCSLPIFIIEGNDKFSVRS